MIRSGNRIVFLDIDGVFNSIKWFESRDYLETRKSLPYPLMQLDPEPIGLFVRLLRETGARVVISSVWRYGRDMKFFRDVFRDRGTPFPRGSLVGRTPSLTGGTRGEEIGLWLARNRFWGRYLIVDDDNDMLPGQMEHLIRVDERVGFSEGDYAEAVMKIEN